MQPYTKDDLNKIFTLLLDNIKIRVCDKTHLDWQYDTGYRCGVMDATFEIHRLWDEIKEGMICI